MTVPSAPLTIGIAFTFIFYSFSDLKQGLGIYLSFRFSSVLPCDQPVWKFIFCHRMHCPRTHIEHLNIKKEGSERGLIQLVLTFKNHLRLNTYSFTTTDWTLQEVNTPRSRRKNIQLIKKAIIHIPTTHMHIYSYPQTVLYHNTSVWLITRETSSWDREPVDFTPVGYLTIELSSSSA